MAKLSAAHYATVADRAKKLAAVLSQQEFYGSLAWNTHRHLELFYADTVFLHRLIIDEGIAAGPGAPTIWLGILEHCRQSGQGLGRLNRLYSGGAALPAAMMEACLRDYGMRTIHGWGMTETTSGSTMSFAQSDLPMPQAIAAMRTQSKPLYGNEIRIVNEAGTPVPRDGKSPGLPQVRPGESGENFMP